MELITRQQAKELGLKRYFTGEPCYVGHTSERYVKGEACIECAKANARRWQKDNPERFEELIVKWRENNPDYSKEWKEKNPNYARDRYIANPELFKSNAKRWQAANWDKHVASTRKWQAANPEKVRARVRARKAKIRANGGSHTNQDLKNIEAAQGGKCVYCKTALTQRNREKDHIVPVSAGGSNDRFNIQIVCRHCGRTKHAKDPIKYGLSIGVLNGRMAYAKVMWCMGCSK